MLTKFILHKIYVSVLGFELAIPRFVVRSANDYKILESSLLLLNRTLRVNMNVITIISYKFQFRIKG